MWDAVWGSPHWHRLSSPNPHFNIESPNFPIPVGNLFSWTQTFDGGLVLGVCFTSLECVVAVYVVLVLAEGHNLVVIPEMGKKVCKILAFREGFCCSRCWVEDGQCYLLCSISVYGVFFRQQLGGCILKSGGKKFKGVGRMQPETICIASFKGTSSVFVWVLWQQTEAQYSAGANTSAVVEFCKVSNKVPQLVLDSFLTSPTWQDTFSFSLCK